MKMLIAALLLHQWGYSWYWYVGFALFSICEDAWRDNRFRDLYRKIDELELALQRLPIS